MEETQLDYGMRSQEWDIMDRPPYLSLEPLSTLTELVMRAKVSG